MKPVARAWVVGGAATALVIAANASHGAYFSQSWGWVALAFLMPLTVALILGWATMPGRLRLAFAILMAATGVWIAASALWSVSVPASVREAERVLAYVALAGLVAFVLRRRDAEPLAAGVYAGVVAIAAYALATRLFPDRLETYDDEFSVYRLSEPIGYWNALGLLAAFGLLLGSGFAAHARRLPYVVASAAALPVLAATLYFTFSRGAWAALGLGAAFLVVLDPRRLRLLWSALLLVPSSVIVLAVASRQEALTTEDAPRADAIDQGHRLAIVVGALVLASALLGAIARLVANRVDARPRVRRAVDAALAAAAVGAGVVVFAVVGGPREALADLRERFDSDPIVVPDLNARLFTVSGNGRQQSIRVAWEVGKERPVAGHGAGSFEYLWYEERPTELVIRDAHSLYAEMFAELGIVGLALLLGVLVVPMVAAIRARRVRGVPAATAAFVTWAAASALDWHWEMVGLTLTAFLAGGVALLAGERALPRPLTGGFRGALVVSAVGLTLFAVVSLVGNQALFAGREAFARGEWARAAEHGRRADSILRWSTEPELVIGDAAARAGEREAALEQYREAVRADERQWIFWLRLAQGTTGRERREALQRLRELNPRGRFDLSVRP
jgi:O-antigen ligase